VTNLLAIIAGLVGAIVGWIAAAALTIGIAPDEPVRIFDLKLPARPIHMKSYGPCVRKVASDRAAGRSRNG